MTQENPQKIQSDTLDLVADLESVLRIKFRDPRKLLEAITHSSAATEFNRHADQNEQVAWNERLEFLGDSVLNLVITTWLFRHLPKHSEGVLSKMRASLVSEQALAEIAHTINLGQFLVLSKSEENSSGRAKRSLLADALEALFGAVYQDQGFEAAEQLILDVYQSHLEAPIDQLSEGDYKTSLQELTQKVTKKRPSYELISSEGPEHEPKFIVAVKFEGKLLGIGEGQTKKRASQEAALAALKVLGDGKALVEETAE